MTKIDNNKMKLYKQITIGGGVSREDDVRVPRILFLPKGGNFRDSIISIEFQQGDNTLVENDNIYIELPKSLVKDLIEKLTFAIDNKHDKN